MGKMFLVFCLIKGAKQWYPLDVEIKGKKDGRQNKPVIICRWYDMDMKFLKIVAFKFIMTFTKSAQYKVSHFRQL